MISPWYWEFPQDFKGHDLWEERSDGAWVINCRRCFARCYGPAVPTTLEKCRPPPRLFPRCSTCSRELSEYLDRYWGKTAGRQFQCVECRPRGDK